MAKRIVAVTGEYTNQQGETKAEFTNIGVIGMSQAGKEYVILDPSISIAGVMAKQNALAAIRGEQSRSNVMCSVFDDSNQQQQQGQQRPQGNQGRPQQQPQQRPQQGYQSPNNGNFDDDINF